MQYNNHEYKCIKKIQFLLVIVTLLFTYGWCEAQYFFQGKAPVDISNGGVIKPNWIVKGDFNNDKHLDFAVTNGGKDTLSVYLANGLGTGFLKPKDYTTRMFSSGKWVGGGNPRFFTIAHFQNPNIIDLVTANFDSSDISILLGDGAGGFKLATTYKVGPAPWSVAVGNFDNDQRMDVVVANTGFDKSYNWDCTNFITILWNYNNGIFTSTTKEIVGNAPKSIIAADFDNNGKDDLAVANSLSGTVTILSPVTLGATTSFKTIQTINLGNKDLPFFIVYKENWKELFVAKYFEDTLDVYKNDNGTFSLVDKFGVGLGSYCIDFADFDGDSREDMAVLNMTSDNVSIFKGDGKGDFVPTGYYQAGNSPHSVVGGKFLGNNNKAELLIADFSNNRITQMSDNIIEPRNFASGSGPLFMGAAQLNEAVGNSQSPNKDIFLDLIVVNENSNTVTVFMGDGKGGFKNLKDIQVGNAPKSLTMGDFNNDNKEGDVAVANYGDKSVSILLNKNNTGVLSNTNTISINEAPTSIAAGDFNGNGKKQDLAIVALPNVYIFDGRTKQLISSFNLGTSKTAMDNMHSSIVSFSFGNSSGLAIADCEKVTVWDFKNKNFSKFCDISLGTVTKTKPWFITNGDFDGDNQRDDLAVADYDGGTVHVSLFDNSQRLFVNSQATVNVGVKPCFIAVTDFDSDGKEDMAVANWGNPPLISLFKNKGAGQFNKENKIPAGRETSAIIVGDFDGNNKQDMAVAYHYCFPLTGKSDCNKSPLPDRPCPGKIGFVTIYNQ